MQGGTDLQSVVATVTLSCKYELKQVAVPLIALCGFSSRLGSGGLSPRTLLMEQVMELCCDLHPGDTLIGSGSLCLSLLTAQLPAPDVFFGIAPISTPCSGSCERRWCCLFSLSLDLGSAANLVSVFFVK